jgi:hypothetical protein
VPRALSDAKDAVALWFWEAAVVSESDRIARAGDYVLGLMNDRDRQRAERDLEIDPAFRDAVMRIAERMHVFDRAAVSDGGSEDRWKLIAKRIADLPQMRLAGRDGSETVRPVISSLTQRPYGVGLHSFGGTRGIAIAAGLVVAFALGYLAAKL